MLFALLLQIIFI